VKIRADCRFRVVLGPEWPLARSGPLAEWRIVMREAAFNGGVSPGSTQSSQCPETQTESQ